MVVPSGATTDAKSRANTAETWTNNWKQHYGCWPTTRRSPEVQGPPDARQPGRRTELPLKARPHPHLRQAQPL